MQLTELQIIGLSTSQSSPGNYALVLEEVNGTRRMVIIIGTFEAQAIAIHLEQMQIPRPLTHDIFKNTITELGAQVRRIIIYDITDGMFQAWLILITADLQEKKIDCRSSDAIAMAIRFGAQIFVNDEVLKDTALEEESQVADDPYGDLYEYSLQELEVLLADVLAQEDYETASRIRDIIANKMQT